MNNQPLQWFIDRIGKTVYEETLNRKWYVTDYDMAMLYHGYQTLFNLSYRDNP